MGTTISVEISGGHEYLLHKRNYWFPNASSYNNKRLGKWKRCFKARINQNSQGCFQGNRCLEKTVETWKWKKKLLPKRILGTKQIHQKPISFWGGGQGLYIMLELSVLTRLALNNSDTCLLLCFQTARIKGVHHWQNSWFKKVAMSVLELDI